jgi:hypothetical protein
MKRFIVFALLAVLAALQGGAHAQTRYYNQAELDALLAPVALYPDPLLSQLLVAATYPDDLRDAAAWSRANPQLGGEEASRAAEPMAWHPSVKALLAFPELLARMDESPQWATDLGAAFVSQEPQVMDTVQGLRRRAQASGGLQSNDQQQVVQQGPTVVVQPTQPQVIYVPYYDPFVVYGPWWWYSYRPVYWRPWYPRPAVFVSANLYRNPVDWHRRHVTGIVSRPAYIHNPVQQTHGRPLVQGAQIQPRIERREVRREQRGDWRGQRPERRADASPSRPVAVQQHVHQAPPARPAFQGGRGEQRGQGQQQGGRRG